MYFGFWPHARHRIVQNSPLPTWVPFTRPNPLQVLLKISGLQFQLCGYLRHFQYKFLNSIAQDHQDFIRNIVRDTVPSVSCRKCEIRDPVSSLVDNQGISTSLTTEWIASIPWGSSHTQYRSSDTLANIHWLSVGLSQPIYEQGHMRGHIFLVYIYCNHKDK